MEQNDLRMIPDVFRTLSHKERFRRLANISLVSGLMRDGKCRNNKYNARNDEEFNALYDIANISLELAKKELEAIEKEDGMNAVQETLDAWNVECEKFASLTDDEDGA